MGGNERRTDVAFVMATYAMGGMELQLASLIRNRPAWARDLELEVVTLMPTASPVVEEAFARLGVRATLIDRTSLDFPTFMLRLVNHFRRSKPLIVHTQLDASAGTWGRAAAILARVPGIVQSDLSLMVGGSKVHQRLRRYLDGRTRLFLPNAWAIRERLIAAGVRSDRIQVLMPGVDMTRFTFDPSLRVRTPNNELVAGFLGRFDPVKRIDVLLDAVVSLPEESRPRKLLLAGDGPLRSAVEEQVSRDEWLSANCEILGRQDDVPAFLRRIDYLVHPSEVEGLPNAVLEAMAMGKPVVATRVSDVPRIVGAAGFIAEPGSVSSLAEAIGRMHSAGPEERERLGALARESIVTNNDQVEVAERFWRAHADLVPGRWV